MVQAITRHLFNGALFVAASCVFAGWTGGPARAADQAAALGHPLRAKELVGTWQQPGGVLTITTTSGGKLHGELFSLGPDERYGITRNGNPISSITIKGRTVRLELDEWFGVFEGDLSADGRTLEGKFTLGSGQVPLKLERASAKTVIQSKSSPHKVLSVPVERDVKLEVLDWGGEGPPLILLAGHGNTAHEFDAFALNFTSRHHVYGITRRGWGVSSKPEPNDENYDADRLGDDVLAVIEALRLDRPVLAGHSLAGQELSSIGTRHHEKVSGLIYLDASYAYAFYGPNTSTEAIYPDLGAMRRDALQLLDATPGQIRALIKDMQATIPRLQTDLQQLAVQEEGVPDRPSTSRHRLRERIDQYLFTGARRYAAIKGPVLAIVATPKPCGQNCEAPTVKAQAASEAAQADAFAAGTPQARVVRVANGQHYVYLSDEAQVVREMNTFMDEVR